MSPPIFKGGAQIVRGKRRTIFDTASRIQQLYRIRGMTLNISLRRFPPCFPLVWVDI